MNPSHDQARAASKTSSESTPSRILGRLRLLLLPGRRQLIPALAGGPVAAPGRPEAIQMAFGRRKDNQEKDQNPEDSDESDQSSEQPLSVPPIPSAEYDPPDQAEQPDGGLGEEQEESEEASSSWEVADPEPEEDEAEDGTPTFEPAPAGETVGWTSSPFAADAFGSSSLRATGDDNPWGGTDDLDDEDPPITFSPVVPDAGDGGPAWPAAEGSTGGWPGLESSEPESAEVSSEPEGEVVDDIAPHPEPVSISSEGEAHAEEIDDGVTIEIDMTEVEAFPTPAVAESWSVTTPQPFEPLGGGFSGSEPAPIPQPSTDGRSFPLPSGELVFRNLRAGFTDPARLLRHLASEGHTGVMQVSGTDGVETYIVLVDGYVVGVALDRQGTMSTLRRLSFPSFPNSQDVLNVITYPREIARGLALLIHAPVHFRRLAAMFVNLEGLRSYLSKHAAAGGLVIQAEGGIGVALFDEGKLVGAYAGGEVPTADLAPLRELVKDLDAEIDVRFGGPASLDPIPLDTLLAGYSL